MAPDGPRWHLRPALLLLLLVALPALDAAFAKRGGSSRRVKKKSSNKRSGPRPLSTPRSPKPATVAPGVASVATKHATGMELMAAGRHEEAGLAFEAIIDADPDAADAWSALGLCMSALGQPDAALACQKQVMRIRGSEQAGGAAAYREAQFEALAAAAELPALPNGRRLSIETGALDDCETGGRLWSAAVALCGWMRRHEAELRGATVLELGCGTGAVGLYAAALGAEVVTLTDGGPPALLELARANADANRALWESAGTVAVLPYSWGTDAAGLGACDWVLASDVTYSIAGHAPLCASLAQMLRLPLKGDDGCRVIIAHERRVATTPANAEASSSAAEAGGAAVVDSLVADADDVKLSHFVAAAQAIGLSVTTLSKEMVEGGRSVSLLEIADAH